MLVFSYMYWNNYVLLCNFKGDIVKMTVFPELCKKCGIELKEDEGTFCKKCIEGAVKKLKDVKK